MKKMWSIAAAICLIAAFSFFWVGNFDGVFVSAVIGTIAWLLNYRQNAKKRIAPVSNEHEEF